MFKHLGSITIYDYFISLSITRLLNLSVVILYCFPRDKIRDYQSWRTLNTFYAEVSNCVSIYNNPVSLQVHKD